MYPDYITKEDVRDQALKILNRTLRDIIPAEEILKVEEVIRQYESRRKGLLGSYIELYLFGKKADAKSQADFNIAGVELKTHPLKSHPKKLYIAKERLVFSMIDYDKVVTETWQTSSFLKKNKLLLLMFYLHIIGQNILDYEFKFVYLLDLLKDISEEDILQIQKDWEFIVAKIKRGEAHLLSEADTYYLGACTKAKNSTVVRDQPLSRTPAKPRAFSFKQQYLNYIIQKNLLGNKQEADSVLDKTRQKFLKSKTIEDVIAEKFTSFLGKTDKEIMLMLKWKPEGKPKNFQRLLVNRILGVKSNKIEELEKANVTLKVITLEHTGNLKESISFPAFDYKDIVTQVWYDDEMERMSDFHALLETQKFLFIVFQKIKGGDDIILRKAMFWNFPMQDLPEAQRIWDKTIDCINDNKYKNLPKLQESPIIHVRPHGKNSHDTILTPQGTQEMRRCFWLNAKYIQKALGY